MHRLATIFLAAVAVTACSSHRQPTVAIESPRKERIAVLPMETTVEIDSLRDILTLPENAPVPDEPQRIRDRLAEIARAMTRKIADSLAASGRYEAVPVPDNVEIGREEGGGPNPDGIRHLGITLGVDAVLYVRLSGYGRLNKRWRNRVIASGFVEAVGEGTLVWFALGNVPLAIGAFLEESIRDPLIAVGGVSAFNAGFAPVTLDAQVFDTADGQEIWSYTAFATTDSKALERMPKDEQAKREVRLEVTGEEAILDLTGNLEKAAGAESEPSAMRPKARQDISFGVE